MFGRFPHGDGVSDSKYEIGMSGGQTSGLAEGATGGEMALIDLVSDRSFQLPSSVDASLAPLTFFTITSAFPPRGNWELSSRFKDPATGAVLSEDLNPFVIR